MVYLFLTPSMPPFHCCLSSCRNVVQSCNPNESSNQIPYTWYSCSHIQVSKHRNPSNNYLLVLNIYVTCQHLLLELLGVLVPQLGSFTIEGRGTWSYVSHICFCQGAWSLYILVGLTKQALQTEENSLNVVSGSPLVLEDV
jgi:hypothetical protein